MQIEIILTREAIARLPENALPLHREIGAWVEFYGIVREGEEGATIPALSYEAYEGMAEQVMREKLGALAMRFPCEAVRVIHRLGRVPVGDSTIYVGIQARHRQEAFSLLQEFMLELKKDVPIWKAVPPS